jgi:hypothetical protein
VQISACHCVELNAGRLPAQAVRDWCLPHAAAAAKMAPDSVPQLLQHQPCTAGNYPALLAITLAVLAQPTLAFQAVGRATSSIGLLAKLHVRSMHVCHTVQCYTALVVIERWQPVVPDSLRLLVLCICCW